MADDPNLDAAELAIQLQQHLASLRAAGVEWLPIAKDSLPQLTSPAIPKTVRTAAQESALFDASPTAPVRSSEESRRELVVLAKQVAGCTRCAELAAQRTQTVFGVGPVDPELCCVGEAPGFSEDKRGEPFVGEAGQLLNRIIAACGMKREEVYICNIIKCRPPGNRLPLSDEAANCRDYLDRQLALVRPKFICALGACAAQNLLHTTDSIGRLRGRFQEYRGIPVMCTYHPAYLLRMPDKKKEVWADMKLLLERMGRPIPSR